MTTMTAPTATAADGALSTPEADRALAERLMAAARAAGAAEVDVIVAASSSASVSVSGRALEEAERAETREAGLRVFVDLPGSPAGGAGRAQASVAASDLSDGALAEMAERAVAMARAAPADPYCGLADPALLSATRDAAALDLVDPAAPLEPPALEALAMRLEEAALAVPGVVQVSEAGASWGRERLTVALSNGFFGGYARSSTGLGLTAIAGEGLGRERDYAVESRRHAAD
ncbi:MAG: DNA gyrase modulator, partial [Pseudomonadota bacterium]